MYCNQQKFGIETYSFKVKLRRIYSKDKSNEKVRIPRFLLVSFCLFRFLCLQNIPLCTVKPPVPKIAQRRIKGLFHTEGGHIVVVTKRVILRVLGSRW